MLFSLILPRFVTIAVALISSLSLTQAKARKGVLEGIAGTILTVIHNINETFCS